MDVGEATLGLGAAYRGIFPGRDEAEIASLIAETPPADLAYLPFAPFYGQNTPSCPCTSKKRMPTPCRPTRPSPFPGAASVSRERPSSISAISASMCSFRASRGTRMGVQRYGLRSRPARARSVVGRGNFFLASQEEA